MATPAKASVVIVPFPFSDLSNAKLRPAVVVAEAGRGDLVLCQVTSKSYSDSKAIGLSDRDFAVGSLKVESYVRPGKLFTANAGLIHQVVGSLNPAALDRVVEAVVQIVRSK